MEWKKFTVHTTLEGEDYVLSALCDQGIDNAEISDENADENGAFVTFYLEMQEDEEAFLAKFRKELEIYRQIAPMGDLKIDRLLTKEEDWVDNWKKYFRPFSVGDIRIQPAWLPLPENHHEKRMIKIDPGTAFGTGAHETTRLCIEALQKVLKKGDRVLDVGTGSGILSILSVLLGADFALGTDISEAAIEACRKNVKINPIDEKKIRFLLGNLLTDENIRREIGGEYDVAVANILADVILPLQKIIPAYLKKGGYFIISGIIRTKEEEIERAIEENPELKLIEKTVQGDWVGFLTRK